jgi:basic membrane lipoprotein Med (substrate-binding protein (PBP1-ABC) superfamily)
MKKLTKKVALSYAVATLTDSEFQTEFSRDEIVAKLTELEQKIISGEIEVPASF